ncbi:MAG: glycosyltransferase family 2 protein, partial [Acetobacteraceae bacterium]|nr:glycosyltransferase family 2 protein [Acetobacteraceae bacterium]
MDQAASPPDIVASILIAAHNAAAFVDGAVSSALAQTCRAVEVIAVDDGSSDGTHEVLAACARWDARVTVLRHARCEGAAAARNTAIGHAKGRWIAVLDADDAFLPRRVERLVAL